MPDGNRITRRQQQSAGHSNQAGPTSKGMWSQTLLLQDAATAEIRNSSSVGGPHLLVCCEAKVKLNGAAAQAPTPRGAGALRCVPKCMQIQIESVPNRRNQATHSSVSHTRAHTHTLFCASCPLSCAFHKKHTSTFPGPPGSTAHQQGTLPDSRLWRPKGGTARPAMSHLLYGVQPAARAAIGGAARR